MLKPVSKTPDKMEVLSGSVPPTYAYSASLNISFPYLQRLALNKASPASVYSVSVRRISETTVSV